MNFHATHALRCSLSPSRSSPATSVSMVADCRSHLVSRATADCSSAKPALCTRLGLLLISQKVADLLNRAPELDSHLLATSG
jgi:hypothetical protein